VWSTPLAMAGLNGQKSAEAIVLGAWESHVHGEGLNVASVYRLLLSSDTAIRRMWSNPASLRAKYGLEVLKILLECGGHGWHGIVITHASRRTAVYAIRTYGGVGGRGLRPPSYPILCHACNPSSVIARNPVSGMTRQSRVIALS